MNRSIFFILILVIATTSCTVYKEYSIDVYKPGEIAIPSTAENVAIVYRNFKFKNDTLQHYYKDNYQLKKAVNDPKELDSLMVNFCVEELALNLKNNNLFDRIHIFPELFTPHNGNNLPALNFDVVNKLTSETNTDILISLETFSNFYSEYNDESNIQKPREVITAAVWAVYDPALQKVIDRKTMIDTVFWNAYDENGNYDSNSKLPPRLTALQIASQLAGENYSKRFFASWVKANRMYSIPPLPDFEAAERYLRKNEWDNAILLWKRYADDKNGRMAIDARYNLALAYEMKDEMETAWQWLDAALQIATDYRSKDDIKRIQLYQKVLSQRIKEVELLNGL
ncbi:MAG: tetratricopeptide repeat protein [Prolixibacteraceae bacterium]|nr:tetratricopeptide repeat protein [Prolixibacteraceae bacterium]